ncbi:MAG: sulfite exporter TauE/SafE family protein [Rubrobacter sp.]|nr:sulfite exporter TauE/SafE family protein [Rubrobacter sp.]
MGLLEALLVGIAGLLGGFVNTLAGNGSAFTLPALEVFGLSPEAANGTNRLSIVALGLVGTVSFYRQGLIDWRMGVSGWPCPRRWAPSQAPSSPSRSARRSWTRSSSQAFSSSSGYSSSNRTAGSRARPGRSRPSAGSRRQPTSLSASTQAWSSWRSRT